MKLAPSRLLVALDADAVSAALLGGALGGRRVHAFARVPLAAGALCPSASGENLRRPDEVGSALRRALAAIRPAAHSATLVLPGGLAHIALLSLPSRAGAREFARFRLGPSLPWPSSEAIVEVLSAGHDRVIAAALRRDAVAEYERLLVACDLAVERVHLAPLLALAALRRAGTPGVVHVVLSDTTACFAVADGERLRALSSRRRDRSAGEAERLLDEARRAARAAGDGQGPLRLALSGSDSLRLRGEISVVSQAPGELALTGPGEWPDAAEAAWLGGLLR